MNDSAANSPWRVSPLVVFAAERSGSVLIQRMQWFALLGGFLFSALWGVRSFGIQDNNEGVYAEVAREMNLSGDWVIPHLNGLPYLEKPPLLYWTEATLLRQFGNHEWVVRLGPILWFAGTLGAVLWIGQRLRMLAVGRNAALLLCSAVGVVGMSRSMLFDGPLTCALTWTVAFFLDWRLKRRRSRLRAVYAALAVGVMAKGLIALVLGGGTIVIATLLARHPWRELRRLVDGIGLVVFAAIVLPWHIAACIRQPGFAEFYFINEHVRRFLGTREPHDFYSGPFYYYLVRLPLYLGVWCFTLPVLLRRRRKRGPTAAQRELRRILWAQAGLTFVFFSLSGSKANYYVLCTMPAIAWLLVLAWPRDGVRASALQTAAAGIALLGLGLAVAPVVLAHDPKVAPALVGLRPVLWALASALLVLGALLVRTVRQRRNQTAFWLMVVAGLMLLVPLPRVLQSADEALSQRRAAQFLATHPGDPIVLYRAYEDFSSLVYYIGRPVPIVDCESSELWYPQRHYAGNGIFLVPADVHSAARQHRVWVMAKPCHARAVLREFAADSPRVVQKYAKTVLVELGPDLPAIANPVVTSAGAPLVASMKNSK